ncbi:MAG: RDD family protein [bacterium]|nr:RDD family protein [bacterium]MBK8127400.1 RDD family protein [bacterium]
MFCTKCGSTLNDEVKFCSRCGHPAPVLPLVPAAAEAVPPPPAAPAVPRPRYAGFWIRLVAHIIDQLVISVVSFVFVMIGIVFSIGSISAITELDDPDPAAIIAVIGGWLVFAAIISIGQWLYFAFMESSPSRGSLGKIAVGLQVVDSRGQTISFARASGRYFAKFLSSMILMIGYIMAGFTAKKQALHDILADTYVIYSRQQEY